MTFLHAEQIIVSTLQEHLKEKGYDCPVIMANQTAPIPKYPYISYTITSPIIPHGGTFCQAANGDKYNPYEQIWSFTVQSDKSNTAMKIAEIISDWFAITSKISLGDANIVVTSLGNLASRDNFITVEYEYRMGIDVTFSMMQIIENEKSSETIEKADIIYVQMSPPL